MNAQTRGREEGFTEAMSRIHYTKQQFTEIAWWIAIHTYTRKKKQDEYYQGFMENWHEPHPAECACSECKAKPEVLTF